MICNDKPNACVRDNNQDWVCKYKINF